MGSLARLAGVGGAVLAGGGSYIYYHLHKSRDEGITPLERARQSRLIDKLPSREQLLMNLKKGEEYDLLVIGGGATGSGVALDAATRGLKVAMVERGDFSNATSSKSTKLIHGGVRYLEKAFLELDFEQYLMVKEALQERSLLLRLAPHLTYEIPIIIPVYQWWRLPYYFVGSKFYDMVAGSQTIGASYLLNREKTVQALPFLKKNGLKGSMVYYDGQSNDSRLNLAIALTATAYGADVANYVNVETLTKRTVNDKQVVSGAVVRDVFTGETWEIKAKGVINATGPFSDSIRKMDDESVMEIVQPSSGAHIVLSGKISPQRFGLLDPSTKDGRVVFFLPWEGSTVVGTTDVPAKVDPDIKASEEDIDYILGEISKYLEEGRSIKREDVKAAWCGIRPLVKDPSKKDTQSLVRNHMVHTSPSQLITIAGGKWTTYRSMAVDAVDEALRVLDLPRLPEKSSTTLLLGAHGFSATLYVNLMHQFGIDTEVAQHLANSYGDRAFEVARLSSEHKRLVKDHPFLEDEVVYAVRKEFAMTASDILGRRMRLSFLDAKAAAQAAPKVIEIMSKELNWSKERIAQEEENTTKFLETMGLREVV